MLSPDALKPMSPNRPPRRISRRRWTCCVAATVAALLSVGVSSCSSTSEELRDDENSRPDAERCLDVEVAQRAASYEVVLAASLALTPVRRAFDRYESRFQCCYNGLLDRAPSEWPPTGRITLEMTVTKGLVENSDLILTRRDALEYDDEFAQCTLAVADSMTIPEWRPQDEPEETTETEETEESADAGDTGPGQTVPPPPDWSVTDRSATLPPAPDSSSVGIVYPLSFDTP